jgi:hypothetical protein
LIDRSLEQRRDALRAANRIRTARSLAKIDLRQERRNLVEVMLAPPDELEGAKVLDLVLAVPRVGRTKALRALRDAGVAPYSRVGGLTARQRVDVLICVARAAQTAPISLRSRVLRPARAR